MQDHDYVVLGGGSAGCVLANRLVLAGRSVLLLEAGPADNTPFIHIPATFVRVIGTNRTWMHRTEPEPGALGRVMAVPQGRTLGGGSSVNAMIYIRGQPEDYDTWRDMGCTGWGWDEVLPVFRRAEANQRLAGPLHGSSGVLNVSDTRHRHELSYAFVRAGQQAGLPYNDDFNGAGQDGVGFYQTTTHNARRGSTAATYLRAVRGDPKLTVQVDALIEGIELENGAASGVRFRVKDGPLQRAAARREVIVCAGSMGSPKILMLSGIGPAGQLAQHGLPVVRDLPGVGENYQDHISASVYGRTRERISLLGSDKGFRAVRHGLQYILTRSGLLSSNVIESGGFVDTSGSGRPDVQFHVTPMLTGDRDRKPLGGHGITISPCILRPTSRGSIRLRSRDPHDPVVLNANSLSTREDIATLVRGLKLSRRILRAPALAAVVDKELLPCEREDIGDDVLENHARLTAKTVFHPSGTCRMGMDPLAVVDPRMRVHGVPRLRIADASIMPTLVSGNTNAPVVMIAERCADFLLAS